jgi:hypothetical protein
MGGAPSGTPDADAVAMSSNNHLRGLTAAGYRRVRRTKLCARGA